MCLDPTIFNWCEGVLTNMKTQLSCCKRGKQNQFGYDSLLVMIFMGRVPQIDSHGCVNSIRPINDFFGRSHGKITRGNHLDCYGVGFHIWWSHHIVNIEDFPCARIDFW